MNIYFDFDGTLADSIQTICEMYNDRYGSRQDFVPAIANRGRRWNMTDICPLAEEGEIANMFTEKESFDRMKLFNGVHDTLKRLSENHRIILVTIGTFDNIKYKAEWVADNLGDVLNAWHFTGDKQLRMNKAFINDIDGILIDDHQKNLETANVSYKICASMYEGDWNSLYTGIRAYNFEQIESIINSIDKMRAYPKQPKKPKRND